MRSTSLNFARWLDRLGIKHPTQPPLLESIQPVAIVADHRGLVSPIPAPSGIVGATDLTVGNFPSLQCVTSTPIECWINLSAAVNSTFTLQIGPAAAAPVFAASTLLTPQSFGSPDPFRSVWRVGTVAAPGSLLLPSYRLGGQIPLISPSSIWVPAGSFLQITRDTIGGGTVTAFAVVFREYPTENAQ